MTLGMLSESTGQDHATITERLKSLEAANRVALSKYSGGTIWPRASIASDDRAFFYVGSFLIEIVPQGRGYFEELEQLAEQEAKRAKEQSMPVQAEVTAAAQAGTRDVFVIHGRDERLRVGMFQFLRSLALNPIEWSEAVELTGEAAPYIGDVLDAAFSRARAVVVLFTPDELVRLRPDLCGPHESPHETSFKQQARPNVLFEAGMAMARHPTRTVLVEIGTLRPFSDIGGRHTIQMDNSPKRRQELAQRLERAGCPVNLKGTDWHTAGDLNAPEPFTLSTAAAPEPHATASNQDLLVDLISELEDNLECARAPRPGGVYARPSIQVWKNNRNRLTLPSQVRSELANIYREITNWSTAAESGRPIIGSLPIETITAGLLSQLPSIIEQLKKLF
jgi:predicted nucleotide-binding protein